MVALCWWIAGCRSPSAGDVSHTGSPRRHTSHTGTVGDRTGETGAPGGHTSESARVLPACDLPLVERPLHVLPRFPVEDLRSAWMRGGDPSDYMSGMPAEVLTLADGTSTLVLGIQKKAVFFPLPVVGEFFVSDATSAATWDWSDGGIEYWARGDWTGDEGEDVVVATLSPDTAKVLSPPLPPGVQPAERVASVHLDGRLSGGYEYYDGGDWNGDGNDDLLVAWEDGNETTGLPRDPYSQGGAAVYLGPLHPEIQVLGRDEPAAWYEADALDFWPRGTPSSGLFSLLVDDVDRDGKDDVLIAGTYWGNVAEREPPVPEGTFPYAPPYMGGFALFPGGRAGKSTMGEERTLLAAVCQSDQNELGDGFTDAAEVGDIDGDGVGDVALLTEHAYTPNGFVSVVFVVTRLPELEGTFTYTEASELVLVHVAGGSDANPSDAVGLGDLNGDGLGDFAVSVWPDGVYVFLSPLQGILDLSSHAALLIERGAESSWSFGVDINVGDVDGDGLGDLLITDADDRGCCGAFHAVSGRALRDALGL